jgi:hypothetical protein
VKMIGVKLLVLAAIFGAIGSELPVVLQFDASSLSAASTSSASSFNRDSVPYLDNRSTPIQVLRSYYNAINRKEYVRAYYYCFTPGDSPTSEPPNYSDFAAGYANTASVRLTTGNVMSDVAVGTVYY